MAFVECKFFSETLGMCASMNVILPENTTKQIGMSGTNARDSDGKLQALYLLHGLSDDHSIWMRRTSIERYASWRGIAVIMPAVDTSFYTDMAYGKKYWTYISEEIPKLAREFFPLSDKREDNFVAGLSMGGYGAFKLGLKCPEKFCAAASLSGALTNDWMKGDMESDHVKSIRIVFGDTDNFEGSENDLKQAVTDALDAGKKLPALYQCCGTEDFLYEDNIKFRDFLRNKKVEVDYNEEPGTHEWGYWDKKINEVLDWLPIRGNKLAE